MNNEVLSEIRVNWDEAAPTVEEIESFRVLAVEYFGSAVDVSVVKQLLDSDCPETYCLQARATA